MSRLLEGKRIVSTRPEAQAREFVAKLREAGAVPIIFPTIQIAPLSDTSALDSALKDLERYDWIIFTSVNGVKQVAERMAALNIPFQTLKGEHVAVIGPATKAALDVLGIHAILQPTEYVAEAIVESLRARGAIKGQRFLLLRADIARAALREQLVEQGAQVDEIAVYRTVRGEPDAAAYDELRAGVDAVTFTSSSTVRYFFDLLTSPPSPLSARREGERDTGGFVSGLAKSDVKVRQTLDEIIRGAKIVCIGPITAKTAEDYGLHVDAMAEEYTVPGLIKALEALMSQEKN